MDSPPPIVIATIMRQRTETGVQTHFLRFKDYLVGRGLEVRITTPFLYPGWCVYPVFGLRKLIDPVNGSASVWWYQQWHQWFLEQVLRRVLSHQGRVVIYAQCPLSARAAMRARADARQKVVMVAHFNISQADEWVSRGTIPHNGWLYQRIKALESDVLPRLDGIVYVSRFIREAIERTVPRVQSVRSILLPNFALSPESVAEPEVRADLVSVGSLEPRKNQAYLLRMLAAASAQGRRYTLSLVGDGPQRRQLAHLARSLGVEGQVRFVGFQPDAAALLHGHRAYVHAATMESFGNSLVEALAAGLPLFAAPVGGVPEIFSDGAEGMYWSLNDPVDGANRLIQLLEDEPRYANMQAAARLRFKEHFELTTVASRLTQFLCEAGA